MAQRVLQQTVSVPAGTLPSAPFTGNLPFDNWEIEAIDLEVPAGPAGCLGFRLANNGVAWLPHSPGEWLIWDDRTERFPVDGYPTASGWQITAYNLGEYAHNVVARFHVNPIAVGQPADDTLPVLTFIERDVPAGVVVL